MARLDRVHVALLETLAAREFLPAGLACLALATLAWALNWPAAALAFGGAAVILILVVPPLLLTLGLLTAAVLDRAER
jgi:hypothetical protein